MISVCKYCKNNLPVGYKPTGRSLYEKEIISDNVIIERTIFNN